MFSKVFFYVCKISQQTTMYIVMTYVYVDEHDEERERLKIKAN